MYKETSVKFVSPLPLHAGETGEYELEIVVGSDGIATGGGFLIYPPINTGSQRCTMIRWKFLGTIAYAPDPYKIDAWVVRADRFYYAESSTELIRVVNTGEPIPEGTVLRVVLADAQVQTFAMKGAWFGIEEDTHGEGARAYSAPLDSLGIVETWDCYNAGKRKLKDVYVDVLPSEPARLVAVLSGKPDKEGNIYLRLRAEDRFRNLTKIPGDTVFIKPSSKFFDFPEKVSVPADKLTLCIEGKLRGEGTGFVKVRCPDTRLETRSSFTSTSFGWDIFFGDLHGHSALSDGLGTGEEYFEYGRDISFLDFLCLTDHNRFDDTIIQLSERFNQPGRFVTLFGRERGTQCGHRNLYGLTAEEVSAVGKGDVWEVASNRDVLIIPHQINVATKHHWKAGSYERHDPKRERLVEIAQNCGSFETEQVGGPVLDGGYGSSVQSALAKGYRFGFVGGSDTHQGQPGKGHAIDPVYYRSKEMCGITVILAEELTRESIWDALWARRTYVTTGPRILLDFKVNGSPMGSELPLCEKVSIEASVAGTAEIEALEVIKDNKVFYKKDGKEKYVVSLKCKDTCPGKYYYLRARQRDGNYAYASPVWIGTKDE